MEVRKKNNNANQLAKDMKINLSLIKQEKQLRLI